MKIHTLVIHHSGGPRTQTVESIRKFHTDPKPQGRGWRAVGYHHLIDHTGKIHVGRDPSEVGAHAPPNTGRLGVCVIGDNTRTSQAWNSAQWHALRVYVQAVRTIWPEIDVVAHRDTKATECPGLLMDWIAEEIGLA